MSVAVKSRPILFSAPMVKAILGGHKRQTRRIIKPQHVEGIETFEGKFHFMHAPDCGGYCDYACAGGGETVDGYIGWTRWGSNPKHWGQLWVRESVWMRPNDHRCFYVDGSGKCKDGMPITGSPIDEKHMRECGWRKTPSIHMPRWASRITLEITGIRVERLQDISEADAIAEGVTKIRDACYVIKGFDYDTAGLCHTHAVTPFQKLWVKLNGEASWDANPYLWVVSFERVDQ